MVRVRQYRRRSGVIVRSHNRNVGYGGYGSRNRKPSQQIVTSTKPTEENIDKKLLNNAINKEEEEEAKQKEMDLWFEKRGSLSPRKMREKHNKIREEKERQKTIIVKAREQEKTKPVPIKDELNLTPMERKMMGVTEDEYSDLHEGKTTWTNSWIEETGVEPHQARGVMSSLVQKGLIQVDGSGDASTIYYTQKGIQASKEINK